MPLLILIDHQVILPVAHRSTAKRGWIVGLGTIITITKLEDPPFVKSQTVPPSPSNEWKTAIAFKRGGKGNTAGLSHPMLTSACHS